MNRTLLAALLAATALSGGLAWADPKDDAKGDHGRGPAAGPPGKAAEHGRGPPGGGGPPGRPQAQIQARPQVQAGPPAETQSQIRAQARQSHAQVQAEAPARAQAQAQASGRGNGARNGGFTYQGRPHEQIRMPGFSYPRGYGYRRWGDGDILPLLFLSSAYWFDSYANYGFGAPPRGYVWVRYGPDLLLVSRRTGRIRDVVYGVFY